MACLIVTQKKASISLLLTRLLDLDRERIIDFLMIINPKRDTGSG